MGKSTISMAIFNSYVSHYQRVETGGLRFRGWVSNPAHPHRYQRPLSHRFPRNQWPGRSTPQRGSQYHKGYPSWSCWGGTCCHGENHWKHTVIFDQRMIEPRKIDDLTRFSHQKIRQNNYIYIYNYVYIYIIMYIYIYTYELYIYIYIKIYYIYTKIYYI